MLYRLSYVGTQKTEDSSQTTEKVLSIQFTECLRAAYLAGAGDGNRTRTISLEG